MPYNPELSSTASLPPPPIIPGRMCYGQPWRDWSKHRVEMRKLVLNGMSLARASKHLGVPFHNATRWNKVEKWTTQRNQLAVSEPVDAEIAKQNYRLLKARTTYMLAETSMLAKMKVLLESAMEAPVIQPAELAQLMITLARWSAMSRQVLGLRTPEPGPQIRPGRVQPIDG